MYGTELRFFHRSEDVLWSFSELCNVLPTFLKDNEEPKLTLDESCDLDVENEEVLTLKKLWKHFEVSLNMLALLKGKD